MMDLYESIAIFLEFSGMVKCAKDLRTESKKNSSLPNGNNKKKGNILGKFIR